MNCVGEKCNERTEKSTQQGKGMLWVVKNVLPDGGAKC
jgi:hypothetical protein